MSEIDKHTKYDFPVSRIGNLKKYKLIILLENQASDPVNLGWNPEYTMYLDDEFIKSVGNSIMSFNNVIKYDKWWYELSELWNKYNLHNDEVLALEYYPYATSLDGKYNEIYRNKWTQDNGLADLEKAENLRILRDAIKNKKPVFVYYKSGWYDENIKELNVDSHDPLISQYNKNRGQSLPSQIKARFVSFISSDIVQKRIQEL